MQKRNFPDVHSLHGVPSQARGAGQSAAGNVSKVLLMLNRLEINLHLYICIYILQYRMILRYQPVL